MRYALRFKLIFSVLMAVIAIVALLFFNNPLISLFLTESESGGDLVLTLSEAKNYLFVMLIGLIPFSFSQSYSSTLRETGETVSPMTASIIAIVTNFVLKLHSHFRQLWRTAPRRCRRSHCHRYRKIYRSNLSHHTYPPPQKNIYFCIGLI